MDMDRGGNEYQSSQMSTQNMQMYNDTIKPGNNQKKVYEDSGLVKFGQNMESVTSLTMSKASKYDKRTSGPNSQMNIEPSQQHNVIIKPGIAPKQIDKELLLSSRTDMEKNQTVLIEQGFIPKRDLDASRNIVGQTEHVNQDSLLAQ